MIGLVLETTSHKTPANDKLSVNVTGLHSGEQEEKIFRKISMIMIPLTVMNLLEINTFIDFLTEWSFFTTRFNLNNTADILLNCHIICK